MTVNAMSDYEKRLLAETPEKALRFLRAVATKVEIRAALFAVGYSVEEQTYGWTLVHKVSGFVPEVGSTSDDAAARAALAEVDAWDEQGLRRSRAALERLHPEQYAFVFDGLEAARGTGSLVSVSTLLDRLDQLESSPDRLETREQDLAAIATLSARGITRELRQHLRGLLATAVTAAPPTVPGAAIEERNAALLELRAWYKDWSETARAVIQRKDYLVMLGLSKRKSSRRDEADGDAEAEAIEADDVATADSASSSPNGAEAGSDQQPVEVV